jgi:D-amino-acid oxidase
MAQREATVIGAGVIGLTSAICLQEQGWHVTIVAKELPPHTTSNVAAAFWHPFLCAPRNRVLGWSRDTLHRLYRDIANPDTGVVYQPLQEYFATPQPDPYWKDVVRGFRTLAPQELPAGYTYGYHCESVLVETPKYMRHLVQTFLNNGGKLEQKEVRDWAGITTPVIVNCSGLGARTLAHDDAVHPVRGQIARVQRPAIQTIMLVEEGRHALSYIVPRSNDCILGGTAIADDWDLAVRPATADAILKTTADLAPTLKNAVVLEHLVGLRPARNEVRLEAERAGQATVIHNYGHGGAGFTLCWGCAQEVVQLAAKAA